MNKGGEQPVAIVMAKFPAVGQVKSRLCMGGALTPVEAADLARLMLRCVVTRVSRRWPTIVATSPDDELPAMESILADLDQANAVEVVGQGQGTLGHRMNHVWQVYGRQRSIAFFGGDAPDIPDRYFDLVDSFLANGKNDLAALGGAPDGGYWTLVSKRYAPQLLERISWSSDAVFSATCQRIHQLGHQPVIFPDWPDVDTFDDLKKLFHRLSESQSEGVGISKSFTPGMSGYDETLMRVMESLHKGIGRLIANDAEFHSQPQSDES